MVSYDFMFELYSKPRLYTLMEVLDITNRSGTMYQGKFQTRQKVAVTVWELISLSGAEEFHQFGEVWNMNA